MINYNSDRQYVDFFFSIADKLLFESTQVFSLPKKKKAKYYYDQHRRNKHAQIFDRSDVFAINHLTFTSRIREIFQLTNDGRF